jgi:hypothetical protein
MTNRPEATRVSYPAHNESHLSEAEALRITHLEDRPELAVFVAALGMRKPVSTDKIAFLLEHMIKEQMSADTTTVADQMRNDHWENDLSDGETLDDVADRAFVFLRTHEGIALFNFFAKIFAKTSGSMFG